jgi:hypothetical protein
VIGKGSVALLDPWFFVQVVSHGIWIWLNYFVWSSFRVLVRKFIYISEFFRQFKYILSKRYEDVIVIANV